MPKALKIIVDNIKTELEKIVKAVSNLAVEIIFYSSEISLIDILKKSIAFKVQKY